MRISDWSADVCSSDLLHIIARGRLGRSPEADLVSRYLDRIGWPTGVTELPDRGGRVPPLPPGGVTVVLDERGQALTSRALADRLERWRDQGVPEAQFLIGAADGHDEALRSRADLLLSFGPARPDEHTSELQSLMRIPYDVFC